jgi:hypothetical protein
VVAFLNDNGREDFYVLVIFISPRNYSHRYKRVNFSR